MTIGQRIKSRREQLGMSQDELAKKVGYASRSSINKIELSRDLPLKKVDLIARALETSPSYIMGWVNNSDPDYEDSSEGKKETKQMSLSTPIREIFGKNEAESTYYEDKSQLRIRSSESIAPSLPTSYNVQQISDALNIYADITSHSTDPNEIERALNFISAYQQASPEIQAAIDTLLKASQSQTS